MAHAIDCSSETRECRRGRSRNTEKSLARAAVKCLDFWSYSTVQS